MLAASIELESGTLSINWAFKICIFCVRVIEVFWIFFKEKIIEMEAK